jgi:hypothetical protein
VIVYDALYAYCKQMVQAGVKKARFGEPIQEDATGLKPLRH